MSPKMRISLILLSLVVLSACSGRFNPSTTADAGAGIDPSVLTDQGAAGLMLKLEEEGEVLLNSALVALHQEHSEPEPDSLLRAHDRIFKRLEAHVSRLKGLDSNDLSPEMQAKQALLITQLDSRIRDVSRQFERQLKR
jgi:hypothetical protein